MVSQSSSLIIIFSTAKKLISNTNKFDETEKPNRTKPKKYPTLFGSVQNQTEPT